MDKSAYIGVSLWIMPKPGSPLSEALTSTIHGISPLFNDGPNFPPHVTITSEIAIQSQAQAESILDRVSAAAKSVPSINIIFTKLIYGSRFFKKVYFKVGRSPELLSLARISREEFVILPKAISEAKNYHALSPEDKKTIDQEAGRVAAEWTREDYDPHLSLVYSDSYPIDEALQKTIETRLADIFGTDYESRGIGWTNGRLCLVLCEGPVVQWKVLGYRDI